MPRRVCGTESVQFSHSVMSDSLRPHESRHTSPPCPSPTPRVSIMKKLVALVLALVMVLTCSAVFAEAKSEYDVRVLVWKFDDAYGSSLHTE